MSSGLNVVDWLLLSLETHQHGYATPAEASALMANHNGFFLCSFCMSEFKC